MVTSVQIRSVSSPVCEPAIVFSCTGVGQAKLCENTGVSGNAGVPRIIFLRGGLAAPARVFEKKNYHPTGMGVQTT